MKDWKAAVRNWMRDNGRRPSCASEGDRGSAKEVIDDGLAVYLNLGI